MTRYLTGVLIAAASFAAAPAFAASVAIVNAKIVTLAAQGTVENGTVLVVDGRIMDAGPTIDIPPEASVIDAQGGWVTPGIFSSFSQIGLMEVAYFVNTNDSEAKDAPFAAGFNVRYGLNGNSSPVDVARAAGVTRAAVFPSMGDRIFSGLGALVHLKDQIDILFKPEAFAAVELGERGAQFAGGARGAAWVRLLSAFRQAAAPGPRRDRPISEQLLGPIDLDALRPVIAGRTALVVHVERAADILNVLALTVAYPDLKLILLGVSEGWMVAEEIAVSGVPVIVCPFSNLPTRFEMLGATRENAGRLHAAGVTVAFSAAPAPDIYEPTLLTQGAGIAVAHGMPWEAALKAITLNPAKIFGVGHELGTVERGRRADLIVWDADPLELSSRVKIMLIDGEQMPLDSRKTKLRDRYLRPRSARKSLPQTP